MARSRTQAEDPHAEYLKQYDDAYNDAQAPTFSNLPDGDYQAAITTARIEDQTWGLQLTLEFQDIAGRGTIRKWLNLDDAERIEWTKGDLLRLGFEGKLSDLPAACSNEEFLGLVCNIKVKTKIKDENAYTNVYINKVIGKLDLSKIPEDGGQVDPDDIPF